jgi:calcineurin-like phosphoesterase family protein
MDISKYKNVWFTSDTHFGHANIIKWAPETRPYADAEDMNEKMVAEWNSKVGPDDLVYIIGDVSFMNTTRTVEILRRLNGTLILVVGNHDARAMKDGEFRARFHMCKDLLSATLPTPEGEKQRVVMCHYPFHEWDQMQRGSMHLYGHVHGRATGIPGRCMDVGWDAHGTLIHWHDVYNRLKDKEVRAH